MKPSSSLTSRASATRSWNFASNASEHPQERGDTETPPAMAAVFITLVGGRYRRRVRDQTHVTFTSLHDDCLFSWIKTRRIPAQPAESRKTENFQEERNPWRASGQVFL